ncbi:MAG: polysaccharide biosynthesis/export family protein [Phycisphaerae bacterium]
MKDVRSNQQRGAIGCRGVFIDRGILPSRDRYAVAIAITFGTYVALAGCTPSDTEINSFIHDWEATVSASDYQVMPPDAVEISSANAPEIDGEVQVLRQDGKISLRLIGEVKVAGLTPLEIARKLESLLAKYYEKPKVSVRVASNGSKRYYVFGQVGGLGGAGGSGGGAFRYTGRDTVLTVMARTPPNLIAWRSQVKIIRPSHDEDKRSVTTVDVDKIIKEGRLDQNFHIQEGDIIYVPPTPLGWVALRLREFLAPIGPVLQTAELPVDAVDSFDYTGIGTGRGGGSARSSGSTSFGL